MNYEIDGGEAAAGDRAAGAERPPAPEGGELSREEATRLLLEASSAGEAGGGRGGERLLAALYEELRGLAAAYMRRERPDHTLQATALVHEAYLRLIDAKSVHWKGRSHFFALAARAMRRILLDHARSRGAGKRGGGRMKMAIEDDLAPAPAAPEADLLDIDECLAALERLSARRARIVEMRVFAGLTLPEIAAALRVSPKTVEADWYLARAWMRVELKRRGFEVDGLS